MENEKILSNEELLEITAGFSATKPTSMSIHHPILKYGIGPGHYPTTKYGIVPPIVVAKYGIPLTYK